MSKYDPTRPVSSMKHDDKRVAIPSKTSWEIIHNSQLSIHNKLFSPHSTFNTKHGTIKTLNKKIDYLSYQSVNPISSLLILRNKKENKPYNPP